MASTPSHKRTCRGTAGNGAHRHRMGGWLSRNLFPIVFSRNAASEMEKRDGRTFFRRPVSGSRGDRSNGNVVGVPHPPLSYTLAPMLPAGAKAPHRRRCAKLHAASRRRPATLGPPSARWFPLAHRAGRSGLLSVRGRFPAPAFLGRREWLAPEHGLGPAI